MAMTLTAEVFEDDIAVSLAQAIAEANKQAKKAGVDVLQSIISITQRTTEEAAIWRINYGPKDYVGRRGGDLIIDVDMNDASIRQVLKGQ